MTVALTDSLRPDEAPSGVDRTLIRWMLSLTPTERLDVLQGFVDSVTELSSKDGESLRRG